MTRRAKIALASCGIALSLVVAGISGWVACEYAAGRDPLAPAASALLTTTEAGEGTGGSQHVGDDASLAPSTAGRGAKGSPSDVPATAHGNATSTDAGASLPEDDDAAGTPAAEAHAAPAARGSSDATSSNVAQDGAPSPSGGAAPTGGGAPDTGGTDAARADDATISVTVTVDASPAGGGAYTRLVTLPAGATAYDALVASGASVNARATAFGTYVAAIDGVAEKEHGGMSGWVYAVGGVEPNTAASNFVLSDGDVMAWTYVNVEY